ncbi:MAG: tRNA preQ1(34) S-adenosylmethionine ribosyltransferase-isomerase QueA [Opitutales bacterium]|nr:tRNA preQ1(34) S-adenosylmethionine ribosyltransferase-isomerase QueA [Opitutales bacterium]
MDAALFDYVLPERLIAQTPAARRDASKLLVVDRAAGTVRHHIFEELPELLPAGTRMFRNNAAVLQARLTGERESGGKVECLLLRPGEVPTQWWCLLKPGKKAARGYFGVPGVFRAHVIGKEDCADGGGEYLVDFENLVPGENVLDIAQKIGSLPLPPYITRSRPAGVDFSALDKERYQTVYAEREHPVAAAAPTAGLHFTDALLEKLRSRGIPQYDLTLHIGLGTFQPIKSRRIEDHPMHREFYTIPAGTRAELEKIDPASPRLAVGTTSLRTMEDFARRSRAGDPLVTAPGDVAATAGLFVFPPQKIYGAEFLITNFHLPKSTLMCLVSAFLTPGELRGIEWLKEIYAEAIRKDYRFYSYGDAMLIL